MAGLARAIADIAARARSGNLKPDELSGGTFTITNIGSQGALFDTPILVPPQAAMLGTGAIVKRPRVIVDEFGNESIGVRSVCYLPLTYDHRLIDGADAGRFLTTIKRRLEEGAFEADLGPVDSQLVARRRHRDRGVLRADRLGAGVRACAPPTTGCCGSCAALRRTPTRCSGTRTPASSTRARWTRWTRW